MITSNQLIWIIDLAWGQDGWILESYLLCKFVDRAIVDVHKQAKKTQANTQSS